MDGDGAETIGGNATFILKPGMTATFRSDGVSDALIVDVDGPVAAAYTQTYSTASRTHAARTAADPGAVTDYTAHVSGGVTVTSNAATDLDTTAAALALLENEVTAMRAEVVKLRADGLNTSEQVNSLIDDSEAQGKSA